MLITADAIVLRVTPHGDKSAVLRAWTRHAGARSYLVRISPKGQQAALQPLSRIEVVADERPDRELHTARSVRLSRPFTRIPFDPVRGAVALFAQELLYRVLRAESADDELTGTVEQAVDAIDTRDDLRWLPHQLLVALSGPLGFLPEPPAAGHDHFDPQEGRFVAPGAKHGHLLAPPLSTMLAQLLKAQMHFAPVIVATSAQRTELLDRLLLYYRLHLESMGPMRSPAVLQSVLG